MRADHRLRVGRRVARRAVRGCVLGCGCRGATCVREICACAARGAHGRRRHVVLVGVARIAHAVDAIAGVVRVRAAHDEAARAAVGGGSSSGGGGGGGGAHRRESRRRRRSGGGRSRGEQRGAEKDDHAGGAPEHRRRRWRRRCQWHLSPAAAEAESLRLKRFRDRSKRKCGSVPVTSLIVPRTLTHRYLT